MWIRRGLEGGVEGGLRLGIEGRIRGGIERVLSNENGEMHSWSHYLKRK